MAKKYIKNEKGIVRAVTSDNLQLEKPLLNENYDIEVHNRNMDKIDSAIQEVKGKIDDLELNLDNKFMSTTNFNELSEQQHIFNFSKWDGELKNFIDTFRIYFDNKTSFDGGMSINYIDEDNTSHPVIRFGKDIGISFLSNKLGLIYNDIPQLANGTDLNNLDGLFNLVRANRGQNLNGSPITDSSEGYNYFILQIGFDTTNKYRVQFAVSVKLNPIIFKVRTFTGSEWGPWRQVAFETVE